MKRKEQGSVNLRNRCKDAATSGGTGARQDIRKWNTAALRRLWEELHPGPPPSIAHPIPPLTPTPIPQTASCAVARPIPIKALRSNSRRSTSSSFGAPRAILQHSSALLVGIPFLAAVALVATGCQVLTYAGPNGERFSRTAFGASVSVSELEVETDTNGLRRVQMQGYQNDSSQLVRTVTEAAIRAALQGPK